MTQIFVNLPVQDIPRTRAFYGSLGYEFNPQFSDDKALCMVIADNIFAMLLQRDYFATFTPKPVADATKSTEVLVALSMDNRAQVDEIVAKAVAAGGRTPRPPQDHGFMYQHAFEDPDGHIWEVFFMDPAAMPPQA